MKVLIKLNFREFINKKKKKDKKLSF